jgi:hypothetical protein
VSAVRGITLQNDASHVPFTLESAGLPDRPVITHQCPSCSSVAVISPADGRELAGWLIEHCAEPPQ